MNSENKNLIPNDSIIISDGASTYSFAKYILLRVRVLKILEFIRLKQGTRWIFDLMVVIYMINSIQLKNQI